MKTQIFYKAGTVIILIFIFCSRMQAQDSHESAFVPKIQYCATVNSSDVISKLRLHQTEKSQYKMELMEPIKLVKEENIAILKEQLNSSLKQLENSSPIKLVHIGGAFSIRLDQKIPTFQLTF